MDEKRVHWRVLGAANLVVVLVLYFAVPFQTGRPPARLVLDVLLTVVGASIVGWVIYREVRRIAAGGDRGLRGVQLVLLLEIAIVVFALAYYSLAVHGTNQMIGIDTRLDALYFTASTMATVGYGDIRPVGQIGRGVVTAHLFFDLAFIAALARLVNASVRRSR